MLSKCIYVPLLGSIIKCRQSTNAFPPGQCVAGFSSKTVICVSVILVWNIICYVTSKTFSISRNHDGDLYDSESELYKTYVKINVMYFHIFLKTYSVTLLYRADIADQIFIFDAHYHPWTHACAWEALCWCFNKSSKRKLWLVLKSCEHNPPP